SSDHVSTCYTALRQPDNIGQLFHGARADGLSLLNNRLRAARCHRVADGVEAVSVDGIRVQVQSVHASSALDDRTNQFGSVVEAAQCSRHAASYLREIVEH